MTSFSSFYSPIRQTLLKKITQTTIVINQADLALLFLRVSAAFALLRAHGLPKLLHLKEHLGSFPDPFGFGQEFSAIYAALINVGCAFLIAFGALTRIAAVGILSITLSGLFLVHFNDAAKIQDTPLIYSILFLFILWIGPGKYAIDQFIYNKIKS